MIVRESSIFGVLKVIFIINIWEKRGLSKLIWNYIFIDMGIVFF